MRYNLDLVVICTRDEYHLNALNQPDISFRNTVKAIAMARDVENALKGVNLSPIKLRVP